MNVKITIDHDGRNWTIELVAAGPSDFADAVHKATQQFQAEYPDASLSDFPLYISVRPGRADSE
jgi:hypothetical protein